MNEFYEHEEGFQPEMEGESGGFMNGSWFDSLRNLWQWDDLAAEIGQESQARVAFVGPAGVGKSLLFNRLRGWVISGDDDLVIFENDQAVPDFHVESLGLFVLADLPAHPTFMDGNGLLMMLGDPALVVYLLDGTTGVSAVDFRWIAAFRAAGKPLLTVLNKCDLVEDVKTAAADAERKLGMPVLPISAYSGAQIEDELLPAMINAVPRLAVPLGRELTGLRRYASRRVLRQAALFAGIVGVQPVPLLDLPFQAMIQVSVVMRIGAAYGYVPTGSMSREVIGTVIGTLGMRYLSLSLMKFVPFVGWAAAGMLSTVLTFLIGEAAIRYYEAGAAIPLRKFINLNPNESEGEQWKLLQPIRNLRKPKWITAVSRPTPDDDTIEVHEL